MSSHTPSPWDQQKSSSLSLWPEAQTTLVHRTRTPWKGLAAFPKAGGVGHDRVVLVVVRCLRPGILSVPCAIPVGHPHPRPTVLADSIEVGTTEVESAAAPA